MVMNGDLITDLDYSELVRVHEESDADLTISGYECEVPVSLGVLEMDDGGDIHGFKEKPTLRYWASMGVYIFSPTVWDKVPENTLYGFDNLMEEVLAGRLKARVHRFEGIWLDIGRPEDYERAATVFDENRDILLPAEERP
jgi:NDP-sugar pyrophosphorylase family protein